MMKDSEILQCAKLSKDNYLQKTSTERTEVQIIATVEKKCEEKTTWRSLSTVNYSI
jgi:hypothetical protein